VEARQERATAEESDRRHAEQERFAIKAAEWFHSDPDNLGRRETKRQEMFALVV
jgi:hypothetical protein